MLQKISDFIKSELQSMLKIGSKVNNFQPPDPSLDPSASGTKEDRDYFAQKSQYRDF